jgi:hypothetical protein
MLFFRSRCFLPFPPVHGFSNQIARACLPISPLRASRVRRDPRVLPRTGARAPPSPMDSKWTVAYAPPKGGSVPSNPPGFASLREIEGNDVVEGSGSKDGVGSKTNPKGGKGGAHKDNKDKGGNDDTKTAAMTPKDKHALSLTPAVRQQKAYAFAMSQVSQIGMMGFMMYMSGKGVSRLQSLPPCLPIVRP